MGSQPYRDCVARELGGSPAQIFLNVLQFKFLSAPIGCAGTQSRSLNNITGPDPDNPSTWDIFATLMPDQSVQLEFRNNADNTSIVATVGYNSQSASYYTSITDDGTSSVRIVDGVLEFHAIVPDKNFETHINFSPDLSILLNSNVDIALQVSEPAMNTNTAININSPETLNRQLNNIIRNESCPIVNMQFQTDLFGCNLGEMACIVNGSKFYPHGYPQELIGKCQNVTSSPNPSIDGVYQTLFSARPDLQKVLQLNGVTLLEQTTLINQKYNAEPSDCNFFYRILSYSTIKYFFSGLVRGTYDDKWLLQIYNESFLEKLHNSEFHCFEQIFTDPQYGFVGLDKYFRYTLAGVCNNNNRLVIEPRYT